MAMSSFVLIMFGFPTRDLNRICNALMLGAHQMLHQNRRPALPVRRRMIDRTLDLLPEFVASGGR
jgi:hypothetical protein